MKPFNLEEALAGKPVVTRDGREVTEIHYFKTDKSSYPLGAVIGGNTTWFKLNGKQNDDPESDYDLFMKEEEVTMYVHVFETQNGCLVSTISKSEKTTLSSYKFIDKFQFTVKQ